MQPRDETLKESQLENFGKVMSQDRVQEYVRYVEFFTLGINSYPPHSFQLALRAPQLPAGRNIAAVADAPNADEIVSRVKPITLKGLGVAVENLCIIRACCRAVRASTKRRVSCEDRTFNLNPRIEPCSRLESRARRLTRSPGRLSHPQEKEPSCYYL